MEEHLTITNRTMSEGRYYVLVMHLFGLRTIYDLVVNMWSLWMVGTVFLNIYDPKIFTMVWLLTALLSGISQLFYLSEYNVDVRAQRSFFGPSAVVVCMLTKLALTFG